MTRRSGWKGEEKGKRKSDNMISVGLRITIHSKKILPSAGHAPKGHKHKSATATISKEFTICCKSKTQIVKEELHYM